MCPLCQTRPNPRGVGSLDHPVGALTQRLVKGLQKGRNLHWRAHTPSRLPVLDFARGETP